YVIIPETLTGFPIRSVGENRDPHAALTDSLRRRGWPDTASAEKMLPSSSIRTRTLTAPDARTARAARGYVGLGRRIALPLRTPPEIVSLARPTFEVLLGCAGDD